ncbi:MAG: hypothetical protein IJG13_02470 [Kiritimatiellae bacterium]|nr:hypothetical protein [Kiritimatiellia bacterium]MBQ6330400.1 hypothetical protein [Kiritimatiellia bacterium]
MKNISKIGLYGLSAGIAVLLAGCAAEKITVDYVMPARAVADVSKVNVAAIKVKANVTGNLAGDNKLNAGLVKQLLAMRLYKEGFYQVTDDIWADPNTASALEAVIQAKDAGHGYATLGAMGQGTEKVVIAVTLDLALDSKPVKKVMPFTLSTIPYKQKEVKKGEVPSSTPDMKAAVVENVKKEVTVYEVVAKGTLKAKFVGANGKEAPQKYENSFAITMPEADRFGTAQPSQLKALAAAVTPAVNEVVADISPYRESRELVAIEGGDKRVVHLLNAKAFPEVVTVVEKLEVIERANYADLENLGIAFEAMGEFFSAKEAFARAAKANPESLTAKAGVKRIEDALAGKKAVKESGAKQNKDTKFSK